MSILPVTIPPKKLAQTITSTAASFKMNNILAWGGDNLVPADFGTEGYGVFINSTRTQIEIFKFDPATIADDSIVILSRGLGYSGGDVEDSSRKFPWASNDTTVQLGTDAPQLFRDFLSESNTATITALHTYDTLPQSTVAPTVDEEFTNKEYVDSLTSPAITVNVNQTTHGLVVGNPIKVLGVNTFEKAQADSAANAEVVGIVITVIDVDNFTYVTEGIVTTGVPVFAAGTVLFLDPDNAGVLVDTETNTIGEVNLPLATVNESGVRMTFHKYRPLANNTIAGNPIASETVAGTVQEATQAQVDAQTDIGSTGAKLFVPPSKLPALPTLPKPQSLDTGGVLGNLASCINQYMDEYFVGNISGTTMFTDVPGQEPAQLVASDTWADVDTLAYGVCLLGGYLYVKMRDTGTAPDTHRVYRYDITDLGGIGTLMTFAGAKVMVQNDLIPYMTSDGTYFYFSQEAGNSANSYDIAKYSLSGTVFTYIETITLGSTAIQNYAVKANGDFYTLSDGGRDIAKYNSSAVLQYAVDNIYVQTVYLLNYDDQLYKLSSTDGNAVWAAIYPK